MRLYRENPLSVHAFHNQKYVLLKSLPFKKAIRQRQRVNGEVFYASVSIRHVLIVIHKYNVLILYCSELYGMITFNLKLFLVQLRPHTCIFHGQLCIYIVRE